MIEETTKADGLSRRQALGGAVALGLMLAGCDKGVETVVTKGTAEAGGPANLKVVWLVKRKEGLTVEQFREHYRNHVKLILDKIGSTFTEYRLNFPNEAFGGITELSANEGYISGPIPLEWDCITEMLCPDRAAFDKGLELATTPEVSKVLDEDEGKFIDRKSVVTLLGEEVRAI